MSEVIIGVEHPFIDNCTINYDVGHPQMVKLVLMAEDGKLRRVTTTLDHLAKNYMVVDGPAPQGDLHD